MAEQGINPISARPPATQEAIGGTGALIATSLERELNRLKRLDIAETQPKIQFRKVLHELLDPEIVPEVKKRREKKPYEEELNYYERLIRISPKYRREQKEEKKEKGKREGSETAKEEKVIDFFGKKAVDLEILKKYAVYYAKKVLGLPKDEQEAIQKELNNLKALLGLDEVILENFQRQIQKAIAETLSLKIQAILFKMLLKPSQLVEWVLYKGKNQLERQILSVIFKEDFKPEALPVQELVEIASQVGLDLEEYLKLWSLENIIITASGKVSVESLKVQEIELLLDQLRLLKIEELLADNLRKLIITRLKIQGSLRNLRELGINQETVIEIETQARRIAWLKTIAALKELHLKRVFTSSASQFDLYSKEIVLKTRMARRLGFDIPKEGVAWIEAELETLAFNTATYKLDLLKSMQNLAFDKEREKDLKHLASTINRLKRKKEQVHEIHLILEWLSRFFKFSGV